MKSLTKLLLLALCSLLYTTAANADVSVRIGKNSARFYYNSAERWHNNKVNLDCVFVRRLRNAPKVDGVVFFSAHTFDRKYRNPGGRIVVAVSADRADAFARKYGAAVRYSNRRHHAVRYKSLHGVFRRLDGDIAYLDLSGQRPDLVIAHRDNVRGAVIYGMGTRKRPCGCHYCKP